MVWNNSDGLQIRFGNETSAPARVGSPSTMGNTKELHVKIVGTELALASAVVGTYPNHALPDNAFIESALFIVTTAFDSAADGASLNLGMVQADDGTTAIDVDGIDVAITEANMDSVDKEVVTDGALIGTTITEPAMIVADADGELFTSGEGHLIIKYHIKPDYGT